VFHELPNRHVLFLILTLPWLLHTGPYAQHWNWIETSDGQRQGVVFDIDMQIRSIEWKLWGHGVGHDALDTLSRLIPPDQSENLIYAFNGGYWKPNLHAVGICAGERGIHDAINHPSCFALTRDKAWVGAMKSHVSIHSVDEDSPNLVSGKLYLNSYPLPQVSPCIIEAAAYPHPVKLFKPAWIIEFSRVPPNPGKLIFNSAAELMVRKDYHVSAHTYIDLSIHRDDILLIIPSSDEPVPAGKVLKQESRYSLRLILEPLKDEIKLVTSGGPMLLQDGKIREGLSAPSIRARRSRRTTVGCNEGGDRVWVMILARGKDGMEGLTLFETAELMLAHGAWNALNLDGGSSTDLFDPAQDPRLTAIFPGESRIHHSLTLNRCLPE
jgi:uncharacterized protein YigE (DUF2233 family)